MRLLTLLSPALLAACALASESSASTSSSSSAVESSASTTESSVESPSSASSSSSSESASSTEEPTPVGQLWAAQWKDSDLSSYQKKCQTKATHKAQIYKLKEMYPTLKDWAAELKVFYHRQHYPGSWEGVDVHGDQRELLKMDYEQLPFAVREWLTRNPKQRHFSVQDDVVFFAPGAIYPILPLFVEEPESTTVGECEGVFEDLENYSATPKDGVVLGKVSHERNGKYDVEITIDAFQVKKGAAQERDEL